MPDEILNTGRYEIALAPQGLFFYSLIMAALSERVFVLVTPFSYCYNTTNDLEIQSVSTPDIGGTKCKAKQ